MFAVEVDVAEAEVTGSESAQQPEDAIESAAALRLSAETAELVSAFYFAERRDGRILVISTERDCECSAAHEALHFIRVGPNAVLALPLNHVAPVPG